MFEIVPVAMTQIDWSHFVIGANRMVSRSPTRELDNVGIQPGLPAHFIPAIAEFHKKGTHPTTAMKNADLILRHMSFSFLVSGTHDMLFQILTSGHDFSITMSDPGRMKENFLISANLQTWKSATIAGCNPDAEPETREFYNAIWDFFTKFGFGEIFASHRRKDLKDTTWSLESKRS